MELVHAGLLSTTKQHAVSFFEDLLGLEPSREYSIPAELTNDLFGLPWDMDVILYPLTHGALEVFMFPDDDTLQPTDHHGNTHFVEHTQIIKPLVNHISISVEDRSDLMRRAGELGFRVFEKIREGKANLVFIYDRDGNAFEIIQEE